MVSVGQNWRLDCNRSLHSASELVPGRSIDTVSFCGWAPCHAEAALCEYTSCNIPSSRMGNFLVMSSSSMASQSTLAFATKPLLASNSSLRFLIPNLHPICTCSCLFTTLTEGRSARDLTQAATSQKKKTCICYQDGVETLCLDVPLLDPTGDFSGPRAPGSFLPVKDVWIPYYWFLRQTSHITCLNGFNDRGTPAGREPDIKNVHHIDGSKPFLEACKQPFLFGFPWLFPSPIWTTVLRSANHLHQPTRSSSKLHSFFWLVAAWVKSRAERPSVSVVNRQLHVQIGCKLGIRNRKDELEASKAKQITN